MRHLFSNLRRHVSAVALGLSGAAVTLTSCSLDAGLATDPEGWVTTLQHVRVEARALDLGLAVAVRGGELMLELSWMGGLAEKAGHGVN